MNQDVLGFIRELSELSKKHGVYIHGLNGDSLYMPYLHDNPEGYGAPIASALEWNPDHERYEVSDGTEPYGEKLEY